MANFVLEAIRVRVGTFCGAEATDTDAGSSTRSGSGALQLQGLALHNRVSVQTSWTRAQRLVIGRAALGVGATIAHRARICMKERWELF